MRGSVREMEKAKNRVAFDEERGAEGVLLRPRPCVIAETTEQSSLIQSSPILKLPLGGIA